MDKDALRIQHTKWLQNPSTSAGQKEDSAIIVSLLDELNELTREYVKLRRDAEQVRMSYEVHENYFVVRKEHELRSELFRLKSIVGAAFDFIEACFNGREQEFDRFQRLENEVRKYDSKTN